MKDINVSETAIITISYTNGKVEKYEVASPNPDSQNKLTIGVKQQEMLKSPVLVLNIKTHLRVIPMTNIQSVDIAPPPYKIPDGAIKVAKVLQ